MSLLNTHTSTIKSDLENNFANGLNLSNLIFSEGRQMEFYTDFLSGSASVTSFKLQELSLSDAKSGRINVLTETSISTANLKESTKESYYQLYYEGVASSLSDTLVRYTFTDNGIDYVSEPFYIK